MIQACAEEPTVESVALVSTGCEFLATWCLPGHQLSGSHGMRSAASDPDWNGRVVAVARRAPLRRVHQSCCGRRDRRQHKHPIVSSLWAAAVDSAEMSRSPLAGLVWYAAAQMGASALADKLARESGATFSVSSVIIDSKRHKATPVWLGVDLCNSADRRPPALVQRGRDHQRRRQLSEPPQGLAART